MPRKAPVERLIAKEKTRKVVSPVCADKEVSFEREGRTDFNYHPKRRETVTRNGTISVGIYDPMEHPRLAYQACSRMGANGYDLAAMFGVDRADIVKWMDKHPDFRNAVEIGTDEWDTDKVERALLARAVGMELKEVSRTVYPVYVEGEFIEMAEKETTTTKYLPPDATAMIFWLTNRRPNRWRRLKYVEVVPEDKHPMRDVTPPVIDIPAMDTKDLKSLREIAKKAQGALCEGGSDDGR